MALRSRKRPTAPVTVAGTARVDRRTKDLIPRLQRGEIAVIKHRDLDRVAADGLIEAGAAAVINCDHSVSGRYPNMGPLRVVSAGIPMLDLVDPALMDEVQEGDVLTVDGDEIRRNGEVIPLELTLGITRMGGEVLVNAFLHDISRRKADELALRAANARHVAQADVERLSAQLAEFAADIGDGALHAADATEQELTAQTVQLERELAAAQPKALEAAP